MKTWKSPRAPRPNSLPRTGKKRSNMSDGNSNSAMMRTMVWKMINNQLSTAKNGPPGWFGTVLPLSRNDEIRMSFFHKKISFESHRA